MSKRKPDKTDDLPVLLTFSDSATGESVIAELARRLRDSECALTSHKAGYNDAALASDAALAEHLEESDAFERASARLSVAIEHVRKRVAEIRQTEHQQAGVKARSAALALADEAGAALRWLLGQTREISAKLGFWNAAREELDRLNIIANKGGAEPVGMPELPDDSEAAADAGSEAAHELGKFLTDHSGSVYARRRHALRLAEAEAKRKSEEPTEKEAAILRDKGIDPDILSREPRDADESFRRGLAQQEVRWIRGQGRRDPAPTTRI